MLTYFKGIFLLREINRARVLAQLVENAGVRPARSAAMAGARRVLRRADKPLDEAPPRCYGHFYEKRKGDGR